MAIATIMRIVGGKYGRRRFETPSNFRGRPTTDLAKEGLFNILAHRVELEGIRVLDLFAGTGSVGFEFLSRGASAVQAVERNQHHVAFIRKVQQTLGDEKHQVIMKDVLRFIREHTHEGEGRYEGGYDIIFADPPYQMPELPLLPKLILQSQLLREGGLLIVEHPKDISFEADPRFDEVRSYGSVHFSFFH